MNMKKIPLHCLVIMVGPTEGGKTTMVNKHFEKFEVVNVDNLKEELFGDSHRNDMNDIVFDEIKRRVSLKLSIGERVVIDSANLKTRDRIDYANIGREFGVPVFYIICNHSNKSNSTFSLKQEEMFRSNEREIIRGDNLATVIDTRKEDFRVVRKFNPIADNYGLGHEYKGFCVLGDIHGNYESLKNAIDWASARKLFMIFLGDIIDYGPHPIECVNVIYDLVTRGKGIMVIGNHEKKIEKWLIQTKNGDIRVKLSEGNRVTTDKIEFMQNRNMFEIKFNALMYLSKHHWVVGNYMFVHGGAEPEMFRIKSGRLNGKLESISLYGEIDPNNKTRSDGFPNRIYNWVDRIPCDHFVLVGHDIRDTSRPLVVQGTQGGTAVFMDTGSSKGGMLSSADIILHDNQLIIQNFTCH